MDHRVFITGFQFLIYFFLAKCCGLLAESPLFCPRPLANNISHMCGEVRWELLLALSELSTYAPPPADNYKIT